MLNVKRKEETRENQDLSVVGHFEVIMVEGGKASSLFFNYFP